MLRLYLYARVRVFCAQLHTGPRVQRAPGLPCALYVRGQGFKCKPRAHRVARSRTHIPSSSPRRRGSSIPEAAVIEPISRGVLDPPPEPVIELAEGETRWRGMTVVVSRFLASLR